MTLNSVTKPEFLSFAYTSNFICILRLSSIIEKKFKLDFLKEQELDLYYIDNGYHMGKINDENDWRYHSVAMDMDIAIHRPLLVTCSKVDATLRVWNYITMECEIVKCLTLQHFNSI